MKKLIATVVLLAGLSCVAISHANEYRIVSASKGGVTVYRVEEFTGNKEWETIKMPSICYQNSCPKVPKDYPNLSEARKDKKKLEGWERDRRLRDAQESLSKEADHENLWRAVE